MTNNNETVKQACDKLRQFRDCDGDYVREIEDLADEAEAAHKREMAAKDAEIENLKKKIDEYERQPELMAETAREALRMLQEQDAEIRELRECLKEAVDTVLSCRSCSNPCTVYTQDDCPLKQKWRKALKGASER